MVTVKCSVCDNIFKVEKYIGGECPACGQEFSHDNDVYAIVLTSVQKKILFHYNIALAAIKHGVR